MESFYHFDWYMHLAVYNTSKGHLSGVADPDQILSEQLDCLPPWSDFGSGCTALLVSSQGRSFDGVVQALVLVLGAIPLYMLCYTSF